jgi:hypothetical protein
VLEAVLVSTTIGQNYRLELPVRAAFSRCDADYAARSPGRDDGPPSLTVRFVPGEIRRGPESEVRTTFSVAVDGTAMVEYAVHGGGGVGSDDDEAAPTAVLLCGSGDPEGETWGPLWAQRDPSETNMLTITCRRDPVQWLDAWEEHVGDLPVKMGVIRVGRPMDPTVDLDRSTHEGIALPLTSVERPSDVGELYTAITLYVSEWLYTDQRTVVWLESLTPLLRNVGLDRTLEFVERLRDRLQPVDATVYFRLDPAAHDEYAVDLLRTSFDLVVESDGGSTAVPDELLEVPRRRTLLRTLRAANGPLSIEDGAARVAARENDRHPDGVEPADARLVAIDLRHSHLPKLANAGLVAVDEERRTVTLDVPSHRVEACLSRFEDANGADEKGGV